MFGQSRQSYYRSLWGESKKQAQAKLVIEKVSAVRNLMPRLGTRKIYHILHRELRCMYIGRDKLFHILRSNQLLIQPKRNYRITTDSHHRFRKHKNLIENLSVEHPEQVWVSDITYIGGRDRNCYLSLITDAYSKKIMGYDLSNSLATNGSLRALKMAVKGRKYKGPLIYHSDRGVQYCSDEYQKVLKKKAFTTSMTESYDPYQNVVAERVNGILKQEFLLEEYKVDMDTMRLLVKEAVDIYNTKRPHLSCHMKTPEQMHLQREIKIKTYKKPEDCKASLAIL